MMKHIKHFTGLEAHYLSKRRTNSSEYQIHADAIARYSLMFTQILLQLISGSILASRVNKSYLQPDFLPLSQVLHAFVSEQPIRMPSP